jgi:hypothetical protein
VNVLPEQDGDVQHTYASIDKAAFLFGYKPKVDIAGGIEDFIKWHRSATADRDRSDPSHAPEAVRSRQESAPVEAEPRMGTSA